MTNKKCWCILLKNYDGNGEMEKCYFENYEIAKKNFDIICEKHKEYYRFKMLSTRRCEWEDKTSTKKYAKYGVYVALYKEDYPIHNNIIF